MPYFDLVIPIAALALAAVAVIVVRLTDKQNANGKGEARDFTPPESGAQAITHPPYPANSAQASVRH